MMRASFGEVSLLPNEGGPAGGRPELRLILNWFDELKRLVPTAGATVQEE